LTAGYRKFDFKSG